MVPMLILLPLVAVAFATALVIERRASTGMLAEESERLMARAALRRGASAATLAVVAALCVAAAGGNSPGTYSLWLAVAPAVGATLGLLLLAATGQPRLDRTPVRVASLVRRTPWNTAPRGLIALPFGAGATLCAALVAFGLSATEDSAGLSRAIAFSHGPSLSGWSGPYPGWFYGAPLILATGMITAATLLALARVAATPSTGGPGDGAVREALARVVAFGGTAAIAVYGAGVFAFAGSASISASTAPQVSPVPSDFEPNAGQALAALGWIEIAAACLALVGAAICLGAVFASLARLGRLRDNVALEPAESSS